MSIPGPSLRPQAALPLAFSLALLASLGMELSLAASSPGSTFKVVTAAREDRAAEPEAGKSKTAPVTPLETLAKRLDAALASLDSGLHATPDLHALASARVSEARSLGAKDPKSEAAQEAYAPCSLLVEAAEIQIQTQNLLAEKSRLQDQRGDVLTALTGVHDELNKLERSHSSSLKADLEEQKRKAQAARDEAEKRFGELNSALIQVSKDARGTIISMSDILFDVGKATLTQDLKTSLAKIAGILTIYKDANVQVEGHTDNVGGEEYNQKLSEKRASNVMEFMVNPGGIDPKRLTSVGYAFSKPIADNATKEGRQKNRRVDLIVMDKKTP